MQCKLKGAFSNISSQHSFPSFSFLAIKQASTQKKREPTEFSIIFMISFQPLQYYKAQHLIPEDICMYVWVCSKHINSHDQNMPFFLSRWYLSVCVCVFEHNMQLM